MFKSLSIILVAFFVQGALSQEIFDGQCPEVKPLKYFNFKAFMGRYYGIQVFPSSSPILNNTRCILGDYSLTGKNTAEIAAVGINIDSGAVERQQVPIRNFGNGALSFGINNQSLNKINTHVLGIDYKNWVVVYTCTNVNKNQYSEVAWVISRNPTLSKRYIAEAHKTLESVNFDTSRLVPYVQKNCPADL